MGLINAIVIHDHVTELTIPSSIRVSVDGIVRGWCSTVDIGLLTWSRLLLRKWRIGGGVCASGLGFARLLAGPPRMGGRVAHWSSLTHDEPILGNVLHLLLTLSHLNLFQMLILGHLKLILLRVGREGVTVISTAHGGIHKGVLSTRRLWIKWVMPWINQLIILQHVLVRIFPGEEPSLSMAVGSFLLVNVEASVGDFFTTGHDGSLLRGWTLALGKMNQILAHEGIGLSSLNWYLNWLLVLIDLLILLLKRLFKLHILVIHLLHLLLFASENRVLRGRNNFIWATLHRISIWPWIGGPASLELLAHLLGMNVAHVVRKALCFDAIYRRIVLAVDAWIWHALMLSILVRVAQALNVLGSIRLNVRHFSE